MRRGRVRGLTSIIMFTLRIIGLILMLIYSFLNLELAVGIVLTPFSLFAIFSFYIGIKEDIEWLKKGNK